MGVGECTDFPVAEQPGDFGNGQIHVLQIPSGKIRPQPVEYGREGESLHREPAPERTRAYTELAGDFGRTRLSVRQERSNRIFYANPESTVAGPMRTGFFAVSDQQSIQKRISAENGHLLCSTEKYDLVRISTEGDVAAHERIHLGTTAFASMNEADTARQQVTIGKTSADTDQGCNPGLNLMPIRKTLDPQVPYAYRKLFSLTHLQANAFIDERAVALAPAKRVPQHIGRIQDVIEKSHLTRIHIAR
jgi:hypothetical protein